MTKVISHPKISVGKKISLVENDNGCGWHRVSCPGLGVSTACWLLFLVLTIPRPATAETKIESKLEGAVLIDPRSFEFKVPPGELIAGDDRNVLVKNDAGIKIVAKIYVQVGENFICLMPDGQLKDFTKDEATITGQPFKPAESKQIADELLNGYFKGFKAKTSPRYVYIYNTSEEFAEVTSRIIESMLRGVVSFAKGQRIDVNYPEIPLVVTMFRTEAEYQKYRAMPPGVVAYYNVISNHVVLYEESDLIRVDPELGVKQALSTIAHEGAHQILHNIGVQKRLSVWPMWLSEGLAEYYAPTEPGRGMRWKGAGQVNDFRMFELESFLGSRTNLELDGETVQHTVLADKLTSAGYASAWSLVHFLAKNERSEFNGFVNKLSQLEPLQGYASDRSPVIKANVKLFEESFGDDWSKLEAKLIAHLKKQDYQSPFADYPHYVVFLIYQQDGKPVRRVNTFLNPRTAQEWVAMFVNELPDEAKQSAKAQVQRFVNREIARVQTAQWLNEK